MTSVVKRATTKTTSVLRVGKGQVLSSPQPRTPFPFPQGNWDKTLCFKGWALPNPEKRGKKSITNDSGVGSNGKILRE